MTRTSRAQARRRDAATERSIDAAKADVARAQARERARAKAEHQARREAERAQAATVTEDDLRSAIAVRTRYGWHRVLRVNAKTVTVATPWSWTERIRHDQILEVRT